MQRASHTRAPWRGRLPIAAALLVLLCALALGVTRGERGRRRAAQPQRRSAQLRRDPDRRPDARRALRDLQAPTPARPQTRAMPNTLDLIAKRGMTLQPLLRLLPALLPLASQPADRPLRPQHRRQRQRPAQRRLLRLLLPRRLRPQPRHLAAGRRLPHDPHRQVPQRLRRRALQRRRQRAARLGRLALGAEGRHPTPLLRLHAQQRRRGQRPGAYGDPGSSETREYGQRDDEGCPFAPPEGRPCLYATDLFNWHGPRRDAGDAGRAALLPAARLHGAARRLPPPRRAGAGAAPLRLVQGQAAPPRSLGRLRRGQCQRQAPLHPRSRPPDRQGQAHLPGLLGEAARVAALDRRRGQADRRHARAAAPAAQHLRHLHLRQRLLLRRAPPDRRQVPLLRAGHPHALPDPRPRDQARQLDRRAGGEHRHRADRPRTRRRRRRQEHRRALDGPLPARPGTAHAAARSSSSPSSKRATSKPTVRSPPAAKATAASRAATAAPTPGSPRPGSRAPRRAARRTPRSWRRRTTTRESASAPTSTSPGRAARRSSTTSTATRTSSTTSSRRRTSSRSATSCIGSCGASRTASVATAAR